MAKQYGLNNTVDFASGNLMSFGKSFSRLSGQPLDKSEVWYNDLQALKDYALTDAAYVGQKVFHVDTTNNTVTHYSIELDGSLKELGKTVAGDEKTITVNTDGTVSLFGVQGLALEKTVTDGEGNQNTVKINYQPLLVDGKLTWVEPSATTIEGLATEIEGIKTRLSTIEGTVAQLPKEDTNTTYEFTGTSKTSNVSFSVLDSDNNTETIQLDTFSQDEITEKIAEAVNGIVIPNVPVTNVSGDGKVISVTNTEGDYKVAANINLSYVPATTDTNAKLQLIGLNDSEGKPQIIGEIDASDFVLDGMVETATIEKKSDDKTYLILTLNTAAGSKTVEADVSTLIDVYTAGNGIDITDNKISILIDSDNSEDFLSSDANGLKVTGVQDAINSALDTAKQYADDNDADTTYTFTESSENGEFIVTPKDGEAQSVKIHGLGSAAYTDSTAYAPSDIDTGVMAIMTGSTNGTISVDGEDVAIYGLGSAAYKSADTFVQSDEIDSIITNSLVNYLKAEDISKTYATKEELNGKLSTSDFNLAIAGYATTSSLGALQDEVDDIKGNYVTQEQLTNSLSNKITTTGLAEQLASYLTIDNAEKTYIKKTDTINVNQLSQTDGDILILNGGDASTGIEETINN